LKARIVDLPSKAKWTLAAVPLALMLVSCAQDRAASSAGPKADGKPASAGEGFSDVRIKEITKVAPMASVVLEKNCPNIVEPYRLTDNVASLGAFSFHQGIESMGAEFGKLFGAKSPAPANQTSISTSTRLAAKQLNWLPMSAEVLYGEQSHKEETNILDRDGKLGKKYYPVADGMLQQILATINEKHDYQFKLFILKNSGHNALARPGGFLYVDQGLIDNPVQHPKAKFALAHEIAHVLQRHETKALQSMVVDSFTLRDDLLKTMANARSDPAVILAHVKAGKGVFTQHHIDQELQADSCAARLLGRVYPDRQDLAKSLDAFLKDLPKPERPRPASAPLQSDTEKLAAAAYDIVNTPVRRHPNSEQREQNLRAIYDEIGKSAPPKRK
jgi:Peptidase family M48